MKNRSTVRGLKRSRKKRINDLNQDAIKEGLTGTGGKSGGDG